MLAMIYALAASGFELAGWGWRSLFWPIYVAKLVAEKHLGHPKGQRNAR